MTIQTVSIANSENIMRVVLLFIFPANAIRQMIVDKP